VIEVKRAVADHPQDDMLDCPGRSYGSSPDRSWKLLDLAVADHVAEGTDPRAGDALVGIETQLAVRVLPSAVLQGAQGDGDVSKNRLSHTWGRTDGGIAS